MKDITKLASDLIRKNIHLIGERKFHELLNCWEYYEGIQDMDTAADIVGRISALLLEAKIPFMDYLEFLPSNSLWGVKMTTLTIPKNIHGIGDYAITDSEIKHIVINGKLNYVGEGAFSYCHSLETVTFRGRVESFYEEVFWESPNVEHIYYNGSKEEFANIPGVIYIWNNLPNVTVHCTDGEATRPTK